MADTSYWQFIVLWIREGGEVIILLRHFGRKTLDFCEEMCQEGGWGPILHQNPVTSFMDDP